MEDDGVDIFCQVWKNEAGGQGQRVKGREGGVKEDTGKEYQIKAKWITVIVKMYTCN